MNDLIFLDSVRKMPLMSLPVRSVAVRLQGGNTVLISPGSRLSREQLLTLSNVTDLVAPNTFHGAGMKQAKEVFPQARCWGVPGLNEPLLLDPKTWPYQNELTLVPFNGLPKLNEISFLHRKSKTLIVADAAFNLQKARGIGPWLILNLFGTYRKFGVSKFWLKYLEDETAFRRSLEELFLEDFDNVVVSHGEAVEGRGKEVLRGALVARGLQI